MRILLLATYEMGKQPFGLASPAAWLRAAGHTVEVVDLTRSTLPLGTILDAHLVAIHVPMHTAAHLALKIIKKIKIANPEARLCCYGLYAPLNEELFRASGAEAVLGGEFEQGLVDWAAGKATNKVSLHRQKFLLPDRTGLPPLKRYAKLISSEGPKLSGYTEASRGCKHLCRHCPIVPVYRGAFRVVQRDVVLADIRQQVEAGAGHVTFGDPDFFNGVGHALPLVEAMHAEFPDVTYDVTIKVEHLLKHRDALPALRRTGCAFVTSAVESLDDAVLARLDKGHTQADFYQTVHLMRDAGLTLSPTFVTFTPWTTREAYCDLLRSLVELNLVENVAPIQLCIRLLIPAGSRLLELPEVQDLVGPFDPDTMVHPWQHPDPAMDQLCSELQKMVELADKRGALRPEVFQRIWEMANEVPFTLLLPDRATVPYLNEPWYC